MDMSRPHRLRRCRLMTMITHTPAHNQTSIKPLIHSNRFVSRHFSNSGQKKWRKQKTKTKKRSKIPFQFIHNKSINEINKTSKNKRPGARPRPLRGQPLVAAVEWAWSNQIIELYDWWSLTTPRHSNRWYYSRDYHQDGQWFNYNQLKSMKLDDEFLRYPINHQRKQDLTGPKFGRLERAIAVESTNPIALGLNAVN